MSQIASPWLAQLAKRRPFELGGDAKADVAIVGGGIAGIATAAYVLKDTTLSVVLVDAGRIAHGATGHNAGQLVADFERPLQSLIGEYGLGPALRAQTEVEGAWIGVDWLIQSFGLSTRLQRCRGFAGFMTAGHVRAHLDAAALRVRHGLEPEPLLVAAGSRAEALLTRADERLAVVLPHSVVLRLLRTDDPSYVAAATLPKGCMNSAHFCEELAGSMLASYKDRFAIAEHLPVRDVTLSGSGAVLRTDAQSVVADSVVLCTNGFENIRIHNADGPDIDRGFHRMVQGIVGYMGGYLDEPDASPMAISYFRDQRTHADPYTYLTRRPYDLEGAANTLLCLGGPERILPDRAEYDPLAPFPADVEEQIDRAFYATYRHGDSRPLPAFRWHGLMGYTPTGIRCVGRDPRSASLLYNLGCNGVGILPSIAGGRRIARVLSGAALEPSLFDPAVQMR
jgi:glycine/D-amino acid oxidase-like deaminating enzyme